MSSEKPIAVYTLCKKCGKVFEQYRSYHKYCSLECRQEKYKRNYTYKKKKITEKKCKNCGRVFETHDDKKLYCTTECYEKHKERFYESVEPHDVVCICGETFSTTHDNKKYCSPECSIDARDIRNNKRKLKELNK